MTAALQLDRKAITEAGAGADGQHLLERLRTHAKALGFSQIGVADVNLEAAEPGLLAWLHNGFHGEMAYMQMHGLRRARPAELVPGTVRVITARMDYLPRATPDDWQAIEWKRLDEPARAQVSLYARGRDYHKVLRGRLQRLAEALAEWVGPYGHRVFTDSAPVLEAELATRSGLGWRGKHTLVLDREAGSTFFLGEIYVDFDLPLTEATSAHCGSCTACIDICPTHAIVAPGQLDARRCISYLTIEHGGPIPVELRPALGNRIYGCDDCQLACPWNRWAQRSELPDFDVRTPFAEATLLELFAWDEATFLRATEGSAIRRIGHVRWQRNLAVALGNALRARPDADTATTIVAALRARRDGANALVREHIDWALAQTVPAGAPADAGAEAHAEPTPGTSGP
jgi:epoxyqueuosine reductase